MILGRIGLAMMEKLEDFICKHSSDAERMQVHIIYYESHDDVWGCVYSGTLDGAPEWTRSHMVSKTYKKYDGDALVIEIQVP